MTRRNPVFGREGGELVGAFGHGFVVQTNLDSQGVDVESINANAFLASGEHH